MNKRIKETENLIFFSVATAENTAFGVHSMK